MKAAARYPDKLCEDICNGVKSYKRNRVVKLLADVKRDKHREEEENIT